MQKICKKYARNMQEICRKYAENMQKYAPDMQIYAGNMQEICRKYARNMQKYARNMQEICRNMQKICRKYAPDMQKYAIKYAENMQEYAGICIGAYSAYLAYICTPHFADVTRPTCDRLIAGSIPTLCGALAVWPETSVSNSLVG